MCMCLLRAMSGDVKVWALALTCLHFLDKLTVFNFILQEDLNLVSQEKR